MARRAPSSASTAAPISLDATFYRELRRYYTRNKGEIRRHYKQLSRVILDYNDPKNARTGQFLRQPQFEALEMYVFLKEYLHSRPVHEIFRDWYKKRNGFEKRAVVAGMEGSLALGEEFSFNEEAYNAVFRKMQATRQSYANYIFALTMGVGKTLLMATCIFYEFTLARKFPDDPRFCHNALIFAPDKTVLQSLREIEDFEYAKVLPPEHAQWLAGALRLHYLDDAGTTLNTLDYSTFNLVVSNTQKIILKRREAAPRAAEQIFMQGGHAGDAPRSSVYDDIADLYGIDNPEDEVDLTINQRFLKLRQLPQLGVYVDEAHHAFGQKLAEDLHPSQKETSLRFTINTLTQGLKNKGLRMVACFNFTGTPYVKNEVLPEVVYAYGLEAAIREGFLKSVRLHGYSNPRDEDFVRAVVANFLEHYGQRTVGGRLPKLAFFAPDIADANGNLRPLLERILAEHDIPASRILVNVGDDKITSNDDIKLFNELDFASSSKQFLILVNKGKEGWNCRSLCGVAMFRRPRSKIFVLQASMRCLRAIGIAQEVGHIYLSSENIQVLEDELQQNFRMSTVDLQKAKSEKKAYQVRVLKRKSITLTRVQQMYKCRDKTPPAGLRLGLEDWDTERYRLIHTEQGALPTKAGKAGNAPITEDLTSIKKRRSWTPFTLTAEIARYLNTSPLRVEKLLQGTEEGLGRLTEAVNEYNELLYDKLVPALFDALYAISTYEQKEEHEVELIREPPNGEDGFYTVHGNPAKTDVFKEWQEKRAEQAAKSFHLDTYCFDSSSEQEFFRNVIGQDAVDEIYFTGMLTHGQSDFRINYIDPDTHTVRSYYPDFLVHTKAGVWLVIEVKANYELEDAVVQAKKDFAERMLKSSGIHYRMVGHTEAGMARV